MLDKKKVIGIFVLFFIIINFYLFSLPKNCNYDDSCFNDAAAKCSRAKVISYKEGNEYNYEVLARKKDDCIINVKLARISEEKAEDIRSALEGKSMICSVPEETLKTKSLNEIENLNDFCTGALKEAILEVTVNGMYELVVKNIGSIAAEFNKGLE